MSTKATAIVTKGIEMTIATVISQIKTGSIYSHLFPGSLTLKERQLVHRAARKEGLEHYSANYYGGQRRVRVSRTPTDVEIWRMN